MSRSLLVIAALLLAPGLALANPCEKPQLGLDGTLSLPPQATSFSGTNLTEAASKCLQSLGRALSARKDLQGLTIISAHDKAANVDGHARARAVKLALQAGGLPAAKVSAVGLASGAKLEIYVRLGSLPAPAPVVVLAEGEVPGLERGARLEPGAALKVPASGRLVLALPAGGFAELRGVAEGWVEPTGRISLVAGSARLSGPGAELGTRLGTAQADGEAELVLRGPEAILVAHAGSSKLGEVALAPGQAVIVPASGRPGAPREQLPAPQRAKAGGVGIEAAGFAPVPGARHYQVESSADASFRTGVLSAGFAPDADVVPPGEGERWVRVRAVSTDGVPGVWSVARKITPW